MSSIHRAASMLALAMCLLGVAPPPAAAQPPVIVRKGLGGIRKKGPPLRPNRMDAFERMSPEEQERFLNSLPPPRRAEARRMLGKWRDMSPEERAIARRSFGEFRDLAPERQRRIRQLFAQFNQFPVDRRPVLRAELRRLRLLDRADSRARIGSEEFRQRFSPGEQQLLSDLSDALPRTLEEESEP